MKHKVIIEIDGVRHKLIRTRGRASCTNCSLNATACGNIVGIVGAACVGFYTRFRKCKPGE